MPCTMFVDTETTGLPKNYKAPPSDPQWPEMVELGIVVDDEQRKTVVELNLIVLPSIPIPEAASSIHKITTERAQQFGVTPVVALAIFNHMMAKVATMVSHNMDFDYAILAAAYHRIGKSLVVPSTVKKCCTKLASTPVCKLPGNYGFKWPKLDEAYRILIDSKGFPGAHRALDDVRACRQIYYKMVDDGHIIL